MIKIDNAFLEDYDLDWFSIYEDGCLAHFTSAGFGVVPDSLINHLEHYETIYDYFFSLEEKYQVEIIEDNLPRFSNVSQKNKCMKSFCEMAARGIFSYDFNRSSESYVLMARPLICKTVDDIPKEILDIMNYLPDGIESSAVVIKI